jgi:precorrin-6A/cobalt-precorrin-6A reductase
MRILILGGTTEASQLAAALADCAGLEATLSYAGRTTQPAAQPIPVRVGGFGGVEGLADYLRDNAIDLLIDATHPFAARISTNAAAAASISGTDIIAFTRKPWTPVDGDDWIEVADNAAALAAIGPEPKRVFLTIGRLGIGDFRHGPRHRYLIRAIDPPPADDLPEHHCILLGRGPFPFELELDLMNEHMIEVLVTKNSGGAPTYTKIEAARERGIPVIMVTPPARPDVRQVHTLGACLDAIAAHGSTLSIGTDRRV